MPSGADTNLFPSNKYLFIFVIEIVVLLQYAIGYHSLVLCLCFVLAGILSSVSLSFSCFDWFFYQKIVSLIFFNNFSLFAFYVLCQASFFTFLQIIGCPEVFFLKNLYSFSSYFLFLTVNLYKLFFSEFESSLVFFIFVGFCNTFFLLISEFGQSKIYN